MRPVRFLFWLLVITVGIVLVGCSESDKAEITGPEAVFSIDQFPMKVGTQWTYSVHETISDTHDTITIGIIDTTTVFDEPATIWVSVGRDYDPGLQFVTVVGDTVKFYCDRCAVPHRMFVFPVEVGNSWGFSSSFGAENCAVLPDTTINVSAGNYNTATVSQVLIPIQLDLVLYSTTWLAPDVGVVRYELKSGFRIADTWTIWELLEYNIP